MSDPRIDLADSVYRGPVVQAAAEPARVEIVSGLAGLKGFVVQKRRWVVERCFAWLNRCRRLWRVCEVVLDTDLRNESSLALTCSAVSSG
jgi:transposase